MVLRARKVGMLDPDAARERVLAAAEELFYARGIQAVGMDAVRTASGSHSNASTRCSL